LAYKSKKARAMEEKTLPRTATTRKKRREPVLSCKRDHTHTDRRPLKRKKRKKERNREEKQAAERKDLAQP
jgi:hypothetical protein